MLTDRSMAIATSAACWRPTLPARRRLLSQIRRPRCSRRSKARATSSSARWNIHSGVLRRRRRDLAKRTLQPSRNLPLSSGMSASRNATSESSARLRPQLAEPALLHAVLIEVGRLEPGFKCGAHGGPLSSGNRMPGGVATASLVDDRIPEYSLERKAITRGRRAGGRIQSVAFPFVAPISQLIECVSPQKIHRLGRGACFLEAR